MEPEVMEGREEVRLPEIMQHLEETVFRVVPQSQVSLPTGGVKAAQYIVQAGEEEAGEELIYPVSYPLLLGRLSHIPLVLAVVLERRVARSELLLNLEVELLSELLLQSKLVIRITRNALML